MSMSLWLPVDGHYGTPSEVICGVAADLKYLSIFVGYEQLLTNINQPILTILNRDWTLSTNTGVSQTRGITYSIKPTIFGVRYFEKPSI